MIDEGALDDDTVVAEVRAAFEAYERALVANDVAALDEWFWADERTVRFGVAEQLYGFDAVARWRAAARPVPADRRVGPVVVTALGPDVAVAACEFRSTSTPAVGRQSQVWARMAQGWRIVHAHVSAPDEPVRAGPDEPV